MSDAYTRQLRERVEARHGPLHQQDVPETAEEAAEMARTDPERANALIDAGRMPAGVFTSRPKED